MNININNKLIIKSAFSGDLEGIKKSLKRGDNEINDALCVAIAKNHFNCVKYLLNIGSNPNYMEGRPILISIRNKNENILKLLINNNTDLNINDGEPIILACTENFFNGVKDLVNAGCDIHIRNDAPLLKICARGYKKGYEKIFDFLIKKGANIHVLSEAPLRISYNVGNYYMTEKLIKLGCNPNTIDEPSIKNKAFIRNDKKMIKILKKYKIID